MALVAPSSLVRPSMRALPLWLPRFAVLAGCGAFMFLDPRTTPIVLWDESRMAVNALEMKLSGHLSLVTTYGFAPDLWNTKPPLLVWLMDLSMSVFGVNEWAIRLPSMLAAMGTLALVMSFTRRVTGSFAASALAAVLLTISPLFFSEHGARTGDYEALLGLLTTGYLYLLFFSLHRRRPGMGRPAAVALLVGLAVMTKGVAGLLPGVGVPLYLLLAGRWRRPFQTPWYGVLGALAMCAPGAFVVLREQAAPGYVKAALFNDVAGRFGRTLDRHAGPPLYYLEILITDVGFGGAFLTAVSPFALVLSRGRARLALLYSLCVTGGLLAVLSFSATKLPHYTMAALPFMAILTAVAAHQTIKALADARASGQLKLLSPWAVKAVIAVALMTSLARTAYMRAVWLPPREFNPQSLYGELFHDLSSKGIQTVSVVEGGIVKPGVAADGVPSDYAPQFDFYRLVAKSQGMNVTRIASSALSRGLKRSVLATCDPDYAAQVSAQGRNFTAVQGCVAVRR